jgi:hypothetical protein
MRVAIHQPNFFPWLGFFEKALTSDLFILLDDVQYEKSGKGNWFNRVYVSANGEKKWMSLPVNRKFAGFRNMNEIELAANMNHASDVLNRLGAFYRTSSYKTEVLDYIEGFFKLNHGLLWEMNYAYILDVLKRCGVPEERILLSSSYNSKEVATARLIDLVLRVGGGEYYSGGGAGGYMQAEEFESSGLSLSVQDFKHPEYEQKSSQEFISGLSSLDLFFNLGLDEGIKFMQEKLV